MKLMLPFGSINTEKHFDLSIEIGNPERFVKAWYVDHPVIDPVKGPGFIGAVTEGSPVNFRNILFNPHGHGTHTETYGHISEEIFSVNKVDIPLFQKAKLVSVTPREIKSANGVDYVIELGQLASIWHMEHDVEALIVRTEWKGNRLNFDYSNQNPPFMDYRIALKLREMGIKHFLIDLPSVDKEKDEGALAFHHAFWNCPGEPDTSRTITEFIHVEASIPDGDYALCLQVAPFENDAAPSRPLLFPID